MSTRGRREAPAAPGPEALAAEIKAGRFREVYVLEGDDGPRIEGAVAHLRDTLLDAAARAFNFHVFAGEEADLRAVLRQALSYPMLSQRQLIWVRDCDRCPLGDGREEALERYLASPTPQTALVLTAAKLDGRRRWVKLAREAGGHFVLACPEGEELLGWTLKQAARSGLALDREGAELLCERVGGDARALRGEIEKLSLAAGEAGRPLTPAEIGELVPRHREAEAFELVNALQPGDPGPALRVWRRLAEEGHTPHELVPLLGWRVRQLAHVSAMLREGRAEGEIMSRAGLWPRALQQVRGTIRALGEDGVARALTACLDCERALKSSPLRPEHVLERALLDICGRAC